MKKALNKAWLFVIIGLAQAVHAQTAMFITTFPSGAVVHINGVELEKRTPALVRNLEPGKYSLRLAMEGYYPVEENLALGEQAVFHYTTSFISEYLQIPVSADVFFVNGQPAQKGKYGFMVPPGTWELRNKEGHISMERAYPHQRRYDTAKSATIILSSLAAGMLIHDLVTPVERTGILSPFTFISIGGSLGSGAFWARYALDRKTDYSSVTSIPLDTYQEGDESRDIYEHAEKLLSDGDIKRALDAYTALAYEYPASAYTPSALYKSAKIYEIMENSVLAAAVYKNLINYYPLPEYYDRCCFSLASILEDEKQYTQSIGYLEMMVFSDKTYSREEIRLKTDNLLEKLSPE